MLELSTVIALMALYFVLCGGLVWGLSGPLVKTKEHYLLADRKFETVRGMFSISAAWTWATALFVAPQLSYQFGFTGFFWILSMNTLTLAIFGFAAHKVRTLYPNGFTFAEHIKNQYGTVAHNVYLLAFLLVAVISLALNIYAGSTLIQTITGLNMNISAVFIIVSAVLFGIIRGLPSTNITEIFKMVMVLATAIIIVPQVWMHVGWDTVVKGMSGANGKYGDLWGTPEAITVFLSTGIYFLFRHISLPWADNGFWQRAFVVNPNKIKRTYALAAVLFFIAPAMFASLGFVAAGAGMTISNLQLTNVLVISQVLGPWALGLVVFMLLTAIISILDSQLASITTLVSHDIIPQLTTITEESKIIDRARLVMVGFIGLAWAMINIPGVNIVYFGFVTGCICMTFFVPSVIALFRPQWQTSKGVIIGILSALIVGFPIYAYANLNKIMEWSLFGFFACLGLSSVISLGSGLLARGKKS
ncbi:PutP Na+/proline symporter [uncultured Caudovirales phage]|uniref:PutP Na+/proline symporter n=1 Tax=uncultured Caudovirales phage TaxID=2100421 RepID=A0A6J5T9K7_9CAUD|nr:PutP Na+/proline symporter [uncultured Caudovirales phage]